MTRSSSQPSTTPADVQPAPRALAPFQASARWSAIAIALLSCCLMPFAGHLWPDFPAFLPAYHTVTIGTCCIAAYVLSGYFRRTGTRALLWLCGGSVFTATMLFVQFLSVEGALLPDVRVTGGIQTPDWLWILWHLAAAGMLLAYALEEWLAPGRKLADRGAALLSCVLLTLTAALAAVLAVTVLHDYLPRLDAAGAFSGIVGAAIGPLLQILSGAALLVLWRATRFATAISAWLGVAIVALGCDSLVTMMGGARFSVGWYGGRIDTMVAAFLILTMYLKEINRDYLAASREARTLAQDNLRLQGEHARLLRLFDQAPGFVAFLSGPRHTFQFVNAQFLRLAGQRELVGHHLHLALPELRAQGYVALVDTVAASGQAHSAQGMRLALRGSDGSTHEMFIDVLFQPDRDADGSVCGIYIQGSDVTARVLAQREVEHKQAQLEALVRQRSTSLEHTQAALMHAQKLEAIGKLTGGVAHDFNNVLHIISGNIDLIKMFSMANEKIVARCQSAQSAIKRGAKLSSQLLSFARKQPLRPNAVKLDEVFANMDLLIKRAVGEKVDVILAISPSAWNIKVDPQQLENVVLNLAMNAGDALKRGGELRISARNVILSPSEQAASGAESRECVRLSFADNGHGMSEAVRERAFEPFFSTKGIGKGSGLGLSMTYGFVKQSGGHIEIDSTLGAGTSIVILLPRTVESAAPKKTGLVGSSEGGNETVLVVDDEKEIQENVAALLGELGYRVITASTADEAATLLDGSGKIDLLFTDVIMPGAISCMELAAMARVRHPDLRVLFTSGYTENAVTNNGKLDEGVTLLNKPYAREELAGAVRKLLSSRTSATI
ncbi:MASE4 domain-containing protein [Massilia sp. S19_KUP03_FR1]|uniref:MASE4 domain-containing protein n=1 Tax=Massilia sp. S19_KUP03_FR1 TaxID=3025503 RepID=UPI002FCD4783